MTVALESGSSHSVHSNNTARGKRNPEFFAPHPRSYGATERRISAGPTATSRVAISTHYFDRGTPPITIRHQTRVPVHHSGSARRTRPHSVPAPPYAVQMEPLVQYSQRDPLYHQQQKQVSSSKASDQSAINELQLKEKKTSNPILSLQYPHKSQHVSSSDFSSLDGSSLFIEEPSRNDHDLSATDQIPRSDLNTFDSESQSAHLLASQNLFPYEDSPYYLREPEPIIEIIVKEANVSLPAPTLPPPPPPTKEPVQVFYVKYKKESSKDGKEGGIVYDPPIPAVTPPGNAESESHYSTEPPIRTPPPPPPPTTTLRTIIRPDSETFHGSGLHVTFGEPHEEDSHEDHLQQSAPHPSVVFPQQNFNLRKSFGPTQRPGLPPPHDIHKKQVEPFQHQPQIPTHQGPLHHSNPFNQQRENQFPQYHPPPQRPFNGPNFHQQRQPSLQ